MKEKECKDVVTVGSYVIIQKLNFKKVYRVSESGSLALGKEEVKMNSIIGKPFWSTFKIVEPEGQRVKKAKRILMDLEMAEKSDTLEDLKNTFSSGHDNRSIVDNSKSQKLSKDDIMNMQETGKSGREIVSSLIQNNASFAEKTEYSQEKYIKKKEKKYCQYLSVHKPTLSILQEIYNRQDPQKIYNIRMDTMSQILTYSNVQAEGTFILYDSGTAGFVPAGLLSRIGANTRGNLIYLHSGDHLPQMPITRAMNFPDEQFGRMTTASIFDFFKNFYHKDEPSSGNVMNLKNVTNIDSETKCTNYSQIDANSKVSESVEIKNCNNLKRKTSEDSVFEGPVMKKSRKVLDIERAVELLTDSKADSLTIIAKEHPLNIITGLLPFVKSSRPFVIYHAHREPLQETYVELKRRSDVVNLRLLSNFLRMYQVLPERTHPEIMTNDCGGYLLTGYTVC